MTVKRFVAPDMRRALDLVRAEMGPEAIILSSQRTAQGVEIITSLDTDLTTRGADTRREFGRRFDQELDRPLESDAAWQVQQGVEQAARRYQAGTQAPVVKAAEELNARLRGDRSQALAREIEQAREKMAAAKRQEDRLEDRLREQRQPPQAGPRLAGPQEAPEHARHAAIGVVAPRDLYGEPPVTPTPKAARASPAQPASAQPGWIPDDYPAAPGAEHTNPQLDQQMAGLAAELQARMGSRQADASDARLAELQNQIADMRLLLEQQMWRMQEPRIEKSGPVSLACDTIARHLQQLGLPSGMVNELAQTAQPGKHLSAAWRESLAKLAHKLKAPAQDAIDAGGVFALVGPTGVGKTTTIAKLAARFVLEHGLGKVALITTDTYRVGAHDQLRALGRILNVPVRVADRERSLAAVVASLSNYKLILIDTAGFRHGDPLLREQEALLAACPGLQRILVLASNSQQQNLKASAHAYGSGLCGTVLTKLDETASLGEALAVVIEQQLPVLYTTDGQGIPNDIAVASAHNLVARAVSIMKGSQGLDAKGTTGAVAAL